MFKVSFCQRFAFYKSCFLPLKFHLYILFLKNFEKNVRSFDF